MTPAWRSADTVSPPPATLRSAPCSVADATAFASATVAASKGGVSNAPTGPFHTTVRSAGRRCTSAASEAGPISSIIISSGTDWMATVCVLGFGLNSAATTASFGSTRSQPAFCACAMISRAVACMSASCSDLPTPRPCAARNVLAIAPPIISTSTLPTRLPSSSSLVDTLAPPTMAPTGRSGLPRAESNASSSACINRPA